MAVFQLENYQSRSARAGATGRFCRQATEVDDANDNNFGRITMTACAVSSCGGGRQMAGQVRVAARLSLTTVGALPACEPHGLCCPCFEAFQHSGSFTDCHSLTLVSCSVSTSGSTYRSVLSDQIGFRIPGCCIDLTVPERFSGSADDATPRSCI